MVNSKRVIGVVVVAVVVFILILAWAQIRRAPGGPAGVGSGVGGSEVEVEPKGPVTRETAPEDIIVPGKGEEGVSENVAVPEIVSSANPTSDASYRSFSISAEDGKFQPNTVIVEQGDVVNLNITAVDRDYDFTQPDYGFKESIPKGTSKRIQFGATASGKFTFFCSVCGGPEEGPIGFIIIAPK